MSAARFFPGQWVSLRDEARRVQVAKVDKQGVWVKLEDDWEVPFAPEELIPESWPNPKKGRDLSSPEPPMASQNEGVSPVSPTKEDNKHKKANQNSPSTQFPPPFPEDWTPKHYIPRRRDPEAFVPNKDLTKPKPKKKSKKQERPEIDLHLPALVGKGLWPKPQDALNYQLDALVAFLEESRAKKHKEVVVIHGVGEGILKAAVREYLEHVHWTEAMDAPMRQYGDGATLVRIFGG